jgi:hypothetical protein
MSSRDRSTHRNFRGTTKTLLGGLIKMDMSNIYLSKMVQRWTLPILTKDIFQRK